ncbi:cupin domain-containing protein [Sphingobium lactosutens]|uniref:cupin domain-containing protein n=1 Tax=Sphingobium lactosutens TaxID=522773 RepID=UPI0015BF8900|nr:cupin domain-containing protein [Sphingobium lactosutens]NWK98030.1 cupin domain-containing protein [Sphingobium lactosutens]
MTSALCLLLLAATPPAPIEKAGAEHYVWGMVNDGWHLVKQPALSVIEEKLAPGSAELRHYHRAARQFFYILTGELTMEVDGHTYRLTRGQGIEIAPGIPHQARNRSDRPVEILVTSSPKSHGDRVDTPLP